MNYYSAKEIAVLWGISTQMVRRYCKEGRIPSAIQWDGNWLIPAEAVKPGSEHMEPVELPSLAKKILYQRIRNNHFGIYEYIQVNLAYHSGRMASNRLTRNQIEDVYRTGKVGVAFEPMKVDDLIETVNHFSCVREAVDTIAQPLSPNLIRRYHSLLTYGTSADVRRKTGIGEYRTAPAAFGLPPKEIPRALTDLIRDYERLPADLDRLLSFHVQFERIRPFDDYNGRTGRIILLKECLRHDICPFILSDKSRATYLQGLQSWDEDPEILKETVTHAQTRFKKKMELCKLMQYHRG